jgi:hypothetical protein
MEQGLFRIMSSSGNSSSSSSTDDLRLTESNKDNGTAEILKLLPAHKFTGYYRNNGSYTVYSPGSYTDAFCRKTDPFDIDQSHYI